jgi:putative phage-type endonuclease
MSQDTPEWLAWRRSCVTATDASVIMGVNPYCKIDKLRLKKLGLLPEEEVNQFMQRGKNLEPEARNKFNKDNAMDMVPMIVESSEHPFLGASLDGFYKIADDTSFILEVKCPMKNSMDEAKSGIVKPLYIAQMQHQLLVTGTDICYYYCYDGSEGHTIEVYPDKEWQSEYLPKAEEFWMSLIFYKE